MKRFIQCSISIFIWFFLILLLRYLSHYPWFSCPSPTSSYQGGRGHWAVYCAVVPKVLWYRFLIPLTNFGDFIWILICWLIKFQQQFVVYRRGNFVNYNWGCISIYRPLLYPFRPLVVHTDLSSYIVLTQCVSNFPKRSNNRRDLNG